MTLHVVTRSGYPPSQCDNQGKSCLHGELDFECESDNASLQRRLPEPNFSSLWSESTSPGMGDETRRPKPRSKWAALYGKLNSCHPQTTDRRGQTARMTSKGLTK